VDNERLAARLLGGVVTLVGLSLWRLVAVPDAPPYGFSLTKVLVAVVGGTVAAVGLTVVITGEGRPFTPLRATVVPLGAAVGQVSALRVITGWDPAALLDLWLSTYAVPGVLPASGAVVGSALAVGLPPRVSVGRVALAAVGVVFLVTLVAGTLHPATLGEVLTTLVVLVVTLVPLAALGYGMTDTGRSSRCPRDEPSPADP